MDNTNIFENAYFIIGSAYAGKSTMVKELFDQFLNSGFNVILRDETRSVEQTTELAKKAFGIAD